MSTHRRTTHLRPVAGRRAGLVLAGLALLVVTVSGAVAPANAAKGGKGDGGKPGATSLALVVLDSGDAVARHGDRITFAVSTSKTDRPFVGVTCWQGEVGVFNSSIGIFPEYMFEPSLTLDSTYWQAGAEASCTARAYYYDRRGNQNDLATMVFPVAP
jgi:hypothetical protein